MAENSPRHEEACALDCVEDYDYEDTATLTYCGCFRGLCSRWSRPHRYESCQEEQEAVKDHQNWLVKELKKVRALSEIFVAPEWKNFFMRRLRTCSGANNRKRRTQSQYDAKSYALNFDDGTEKEGDGVYLDFSARYACPLGINKVDLGFGSTLK